MSNLKTNKDHADILFFDRNPPSGSVPCYVRKCFFLKEVEMSLLNECFQKKNH